MRKFHQVRLLHRRSSPAPLHLSEQFFECESLACSSCWQEASNLIFLEKNPTLSVGSLKQIDLHGLTVDEAVTTTANYFKLCKSLRYRGIIKVINTQLLHQIASE